MRAILLSVLATGVITMSATSKAAAQEAGAQVCRAPATATESPQEPARRSGRGAVREASAAQVLAAANHAARQRPVAGGFVQARHVYTYAPGAIYELYAHPSFISTILLEPGETLNDVAAGDTSRWMVMETNAETELDGRIVVLVKPQASGLRTNIVLITDRRTYLVEAIAQTGEAYSAQIAWCYPHNLTETTPAARVDTLNFDYRVRTSRGRAPVWAPTRVFDDGRRTWIEFPASVVASDMPPLFVITPEGAEIVNYRVQGQRYMIDRVFGIAELRLGTRAPIVVRIERGSVRLERTRRRGRP